MYGIKGDEMVEQWINYYCADCTRPVYLDSYNTKRNADDSMPHECVPERLTGPRMIFWTVVFGGLFSLCVILVIHWLGWL